MSKLSQLGKATVAILEAMIAPMVGRPELAAAVGYIENAGAPSAVVPDFIGQKLFDTSGLEFYIAYGTASGEWTPMGLNTLSATELAFLDGAASTNAVADKAAIIGTGGALTLGGLKQAPVFVDAATPSTVPNKAPSACPASSALEALSHAPAWLALGSRTPRT